MLRHLLLSWVFVALVNGHARMLDPPNRSSLWRFEEFAQYNPEPNYTDDEIWCDNVKQFDEDTRCGPCGDPVQDPRPRENEDGGRYGRGVIARNYAAGAVRLLLKLNSIHGFSELR